MEQMSLQQRSELDRFHQRCLEIHRQPEEARRRMIVRRSSQRFAWIIGFISLFLFFALLAEILR